MLTLKDQKFGTMYGTALYFLRPICVSLAMADVKQWALANLMPSAERCPLSSSGLKGLWEAATDCKHTLNQTEFLEALVAVGLVPEGMTADNPWNVRAEIIGWECDRV